MNIGLLSLKIESGLSQPKATNFRPPTWPPPPDWSPVVDVKGIKQCVYSDSIWPLDVWVGKPLRINFGDGKTKGRRLDLFNADTLRQCVVWFLWGPRGKRTARSLVSNVFCVLKPLFAACSKEGIAAIDLGRFDAVLVKVAASLPPSKFDDAITILHELLDASQELGFVILDKEGIARLAKFAPDHFHKQTPYIPPRIWAYQLSRLKQCLDDFMEHREKIEACFDYCLEAYAYNFGSLKEALNSKSASYKSPFSNNKPAPKVRYRGSFRLTADRFEVARVMEKWVGPFKEKAKQIPKFSQYLDLVSMAGLAYLQNFSLMRIQEAWDLRSDCLLVERDQNFGDIYLLCGETTKTDPDSDAHWPVSSSAALAVEAMRCIAGLRMRCAKEYDDIGLSEEDKRNPYLISFQYEPWGQFSGKSYRTRPQIWAYQQTVDYFSYLLDPAEMAINQEDLRIGRLITPSLDPEKFKQGVPWHIAWHQLRRTGAVNMLSSDMVDESSLQLLLKHQSRVMTLYYGRNHSRLNLNEETRTIFLKAMYQEIARDLGKLQAEHFVSPLGESRKSTIVTFIQEVDVVALNKAAMRGEVGARRIRAGFCVNHRTCPYGGVEAIAHCLGGDDGKGCPDLLVDLNKTIDIKLYEKVVDEQVSVVHADSPRYRSLQAEKRGIRKFYDIVETQNR